jgi:hypothetical protein
LARDGELDRTRGMRCAVLVADLAEGIAAIVDGGADAV